MSRRRSLSLGRRTDAAASPGGATEARGSSLGSRLRATRRGRRGRRVPHASVASSTATPGRRRSLRASPPVAPERPHAGPDVPVVLLDAKERLATRAARALVLLGFFLVGGVLATAAMPWLGTAVDEALSEVRSVAEAGLLHAADRAGERPVDPAP